MLNFGQIFTDAAEIIGTLEVDETQLDAGSSVPLPATVVVGSTGGKPIYLVGSLTETKPAPNGLSVPNGLNIGVIFSDLVTIYGDVSVDEGELAAGQTCLIPATLEIGTVHTHPVYLVASLTTVKTSAGLNA